MQKSSAGKDSSVSYRSKRPSFREIWSAVYGVAFASLGRLIFWGGLIFLGGAVVGLQNIGGSKPGRLLTFLGIFIAVGVAEGVRSPQEARASIVLFDTSTDGTNYSGTGVGSRNFIDGLGANSVTHTGSGIMFQGNGMAIDQIEVIYQYGDLDGANQGDIAAYNWRVAMYLDPDDYTAEGLAGITGFTPPDFILDLADPTNTDYLNVIGTSGVVNNHRALVDLSDLGVFHWNTIDEEEHLVFLIPTATGDNNALVTGTALSDNSVEILLVSMGGSMTKCRTETIRTLY